MYIQCHLHNYITVIPCKLIYSLHQFALHDLGVLSGGPCGQKMMTFSSATDASTKVFLSMKHNFKHLFFQDVDLPLDLNDNTDQQ